MTFDCHYSPAESPDWAGETLSHVGDAATRGRAAPSLQEFLAANYERLRQRLIRRLGCADLATESLHDAWLRLEGKGAADAVLNAEAYVLRAATNAAMDRLGTNKRYQGDDNFDLWIDGMVDGKPGPEQIVEARSELGAAVQAIGRLPRQHQAVLVALRIEEQPRAEVARRYGLTLRRVDHALAKAHEFCREALHAAA